MKNRTTLAALALTAGSMATPGVAQNQDRKAQQPLLVRYCKAMEINFGEWVAETTGNESFQGRCISNLNAANPAVTCAWMEKYNNAFPYYGFANMGECIQALRTDDWTWDR